MKTEMKKIKKEVQQRMKEVEQYHNVWSNDYLYIEYLENKNKELKKELKELKKLIHKAAHNPKYRTDLWNIGVDWNTARLKKKRIKREKMLGK